MDNSDLSARNAELERELETLRERERELTDFIENASLGLHWVGPDGTILWANQSELELLGYTRDEYLGHHIAEFHVDPPVIDDILRRLTAKETIPNYEARMRCKDGSIRYVLISSNVRWDGDRFVHTRCFTRDITDRKRLEEKLQHTAKLESLGLLAGGIAHDFNNLLTGILGNISLAQETLSGLHPAKPPLDQAAEASERAGLLTKQLLAYAGKGRFVIQALDLSALVREISSLVKASIPKTVQLRLDLADRLPSIEGDATQLQQLIMNLVINGAEAIGGNTDGTVLITTGVQTIDEAYAAQTFGNKEITPVTYVTLEIHDTGSGMDEATMAQIFDPFFTTKFAGRGLGLAAVLGIVRGHKGALKVYSEPGEGSTFKVLFPAATAEAAAPDPTTDHADVVGVGTALVVDDEAIVRDVARSMLERFGYTVLTAENGQQAVDLVRQHKDDLALVLIDLTMPVMSGEEALSHIKSIHPTLPIILSSGYNEMEAIQRFAGKGLAGFLQKPYTRARLAEKLRALCNKR